jgi:hypothetical protein
MYLNKAFVFLQSTNWLGNIATKVSMLNAVPASNIPIRFNETNLVLLGILTFLQSSVQSIV